MGHGAKAVPAIPPGYVVGAKAVLRAAGSDRPVLQIVVASDAPAEATDPLRRLARDRDLTLVEVESSEELGRTFGLPRRVAAAARLAVGA